MTAWTGSLVRRARAYIRATLPAPCSRCGLTVTEDHAWQVDHIPSRAVLPEEDWGKPEYWHAAHKRCNESAGGKLGNKIRPQGKEKQIDKQIDKQFSNGEPPRLLGGPGQSRPRPLPSTSPNSDPIFVYPNSLSEYSVKIIPRPKWWPDYLCSPPDGACLPRLETPHHSRAVGSYGGLVVAHAASYGLTLRWWQEYAVWRILEHDEDGVLVWAEAGLSVARQLGKGVGVLRPLGEWRSEAAGIFGEPQTVLSLAHQVNTAMEIATPAIARARELGQRVRLTNGEQEIARPDGGRWLMRSTTGAYGFSVSQAMVDEVHAVAPRVLDSMIMPTMAARVSPQLFITSTANAECTPTYMRHRDTAGEEDDRLILEWSPPDEARDDPYNKAYWPLGSPFWTPQRGRMMERLVGKSNRLDFAANWLNLWPLEDVKQREKAMPGFGDLGRAGIMPPRGGIVAIDEARDGSRYASTLLMGDSLWYTESHDLAELVRRANTADYVIVGLSLVQPALKAGLRGAPVRYGAKETALATPLLMRKVAEGKLVHNHDTEALSQAAGMVVTEQESGRVISARYSDGEVLVGKLLGWSLYFSRQMVSVRPTIY